MPEQLNPQLKALRDQCAAFAREHMLPLADVDHGDAAKKVRAASKQAGLFGLTQPTARSQKTQDSWLFAWPERHSLPPIHRRWMRYSDRAQGTGSCRRTLGINASRPPARGRKARQLWLYRTG